MNPTGAHQQRRKPKGLVLGSGLYPIPVVQAAQTQLQAGRLTLRQTVFDVLAAPEAARSRSSVAQVLLRSTIVTYDFPEREAASTQLTVGAITQRPVVINISYSNITADHDAVNTSLTVGNVRQNVVVVNQAYDTEGATTSLSIGTIRRI